MKKLTVLALLMGAFFPSLAQLGTIRGTVLDQSIGEPLFGVTVVIVGTTTGAVTDFDGKFEIKLAAGTYNLQVSFVSFETVKITGLEVKPGEVTVLSEIWLSESVQTLESVMVTAEAIRSSEAGLLTVKKKSAALMDGISAASFKKIGDSDASDAVKRVTGVSVEGGKYVYVRGLGDRYTKTMLNNMEIPGLDPDRNSLQMDIFPTNLISNMIVLKSFTADQSADFTGGLVNIETKDFPDDRIFDISLGIGFNPSMHFNNDFLTYDGSKTDWLGFDNGQRALPAGADADASTIPRPQSDYSDQEVNDFLKRWNPVLGAKNTTSLMDYSFSASYADQKPIGRNKLGYIFSLSYKNNTRFYDDRSYGEYQLNGDQAETELVQGTVRDGALGEREVLVGGLAGVAFKTQQVKLRLTAMHLQNGVSTAGQFVINNNDGAAGSSGYVGGSNNLEYNQRGLTNLFLGGEFNSGDGSWNIDWSLSPTFSNIVDPDIRSTAFTYFGQDTTFSPGNAGSPFRSWRYLDELNLVGKVDVTKKYQLLGSDAKFKFGARHVYKDRNYRILTYYNYFLNGNQPEWNADPNNVWAEENLYPNGSTWIDSGVNDPNPNEYSSHVHNSGFYLSNELSLLPPFRAILGLRGEQYQQWHTGRDQAWASGNTDDGHNLDNTRVLNSFDLFPSVNLIYSLSEEQNVRASYSRTIARPSFKELSYAQIVDPISGRVFNGGLYPYQSQGVTTWDGNLKETRIDNYDIRWEYFMKRGQMFSVSLFYKSFEDPIELIRIYENTTASEFQPRNVGNGTVLGAEFELRKSLEFIAPALEMFSVNGNYTVVKSTIDMTEKEHFERERNAREGQSIDKTRPMAGQAPNIINAGLQYDNPKSGLDAGFFYNVKGSTLFAVGGSIFPDVYAQPFHSLNFNLNKSIGPEGKSSINVSVTNILNSVRAEDFEGYQATNQIFTRFRPGTAFSVGYKLSL